MKNNYGSFSDSLMSQRNVKAPLFFYGLSTDVGLLPKEGIPSGSKAFCVDTGDIYVFLAYTSTWYKQ